MQHIATALLVLVASVLLGLLGVSGYESIYTLNDEESLHDADIVVQAANRTHALDPSFGTDIPLDADGYNQLVQSLAAADKKYVLDGIPIRTISATQAIDYINRNNERGEQMKLRIIKVPVKDTDGFEITSDDINQASIEGGKLENQNRSKLGLSNL